jgi:hypothetical protein
MRQRVRVPGHQPGPCLMRKLIQRRQAHAERPQAPVVPCPERRAGTVTHGARAGGGGCRRVRLQEVVGQRRSDEGARPGPSLEIALVQQLAVCSQHRQTRHTELYCESPRGGDPLTGTEPAVEDGPPGRVVDLAVERTSGLAVNGKIQSGHGGNIPIGYGGKTGCPVILHRRNPFCEDTVMHALRRSRNYLLRYSLAVALLPLPALAQKVGARDGQHDFDFEIGTWNTRLSRLQSPLTGSTTWVEYIGTTVVRKVWDGRANLVELEVDGPAGRFEGLSLRLYNPQSRQWSLNFSSSKGGTLTVPAIGEFRDGRGEFYSQEEFNGRAILVRFVISVSTPESCRFEQSFSDDGGRTWEVNWRAIDTRVNGK